MLVPAARPPIVDARIYDNTVEALLAVLRETPEDVQTVAVVGHNPSIGELAAVLDDGQGIASARRDLAAGFPTGGVAVFSLAAPFAAIEPGGATLSDFTSRAPDRVGYASSLSNRAMIWSAGSAMYSGTTEIVQSGRRSWISTARSHAMRAASGPKHPSSPSSPTATSTSHWSERSAASSATSGAASSSGSGASATTG